MHRINHVNYRWVSIFTAVLLSHSFSCNREVVMYCVIATVQLCSSVEHQQSNKNMLKAKGVTELC